MLKSNIHNTLLTLALVLTGLSVFFGPPPAHASAPPLPALNWQQRSDWINVEKDVSPAAVGDGSHDDTAAIQAALNRLHDTVGAPHAVYFPSGIYRITNTLTLTKIMGAAIIGHGRSTRIVWDGVPGKAMFVSNGVSRSRYIGLTWDGAGKAAVGIDHRSKTYYETRIRHQDEAFLNFTQAGIRTGYDQVIPTAEIMFRNCLFQSCVSGVAFLAWNDYDNDFDGCEFQSCGTAINCQKGNVYVRDSHFEKSTVADLHLCSQAHSIRRCTSHGSKQFIMTVMGSSGCEVTAEDCRVDGWTSSQGAMVFAMRGPTTLLDCAFTNPPDSAPPIRLTNSNLVKQVATICNVTVSGASALMEPGPNANVVTLPDGTRPPNLSSPTRSFLKSSETIPGAVLDVKAEFGAKGDGHADDTAAIKRALAAAAKQGGNAIVYFPSGQYNVTSSLPILGGGYTVGGSGFSTLIHWSGHTSDPVFVVKDPQNVTLEQMQIKAPNSVACIQQTSDGGSSLMNYDGIYVGGSWLGTTNVNGSNGVITSQAANRGLECIGLPAGAVVCLSHFDGSLHFTDCSRATILTNFSVDGVLQIDGAQYEKTGFLGFLGHFTSGNPCDVVVRDNQDLIGADFYTEQTQSHLHASGDGAYPEQPGHITIQGIRNQTYAAPIEIDDYEGRVTYTGTQFNGHLPYAITQTGTRPVDVVLLDNTFYNGKPTMPKSSGGQSSVLQNIVTSNGTNVTQVVTNDLPGLAASVTPLLLSAAAADPAATPAPLADAVAAMDDFRLLGSVDLAMNHP